MFLFIDAIVKPSQETALAHSAADTSASPAISTAVQSALQTHRHAAGALLPILHDVQDRLGYIPPASVAEIAAGLNLSRAEVHGVITFYHHFRQHPAGKHVVQLCRAEACQSVGAEQLAEHVQKSMQCGWHETTPNGDFTLEPAYCLGHCAVGPSITIDDVPHARMSPERFDALLAKTAKGSRV